MNRLKIISGGIILITVGTGLFYALKQGNSNDRNLTKTSPSQVQSSPANTESSDRQTVPPDISGRPPFPSGAAMPKIPEGSQPFFGKVSNLDSSSFTVQGPLETVKILVTSSTEFKDGTSADLKNDLRVMGYGTKNDDGTVTALQIQLKVSMPERGQFPPR